MTLILLLHLIFSPGVAPAMEMPKGIPNIRWGFDPFMQQTGFMAGHLIIQKANAPSVAAAWWNGELQLGYGSSQATIIDEDCLKDGGLYDKGSIYTTPATDGGEDPASKAKRQAALKDLYMNCFVVKNPWKFTITKERTANHASRIGSLDAAVVYFQKTVDNIYSAMRTQLIPDFWASLWVPNRTIVKKVWQANPNLKMFKSFSVDNGEDSDKDEVPITYARGGPFEGRVVAMTLDNVRKTHELIIQLSGSGSLFRRISVDNSDMVDHVVLAMLANRFVRLDWTEYYRGWISAGISDLRGYKTLRRVKRITILPTPGQKFQ